MQGLHSELLRRIFEVPNAPVIVTASSEGEQIVPSGSLFPMIILKRKEIFRNNAKHLFTENSDFQSAIIYALASLWNSPVIEWSKQHICAANSSLHDQTGQFLQNSFTSSVKHVNAEKVTTILETAILSCERDPLVDDSDPVVINYKTPCPDIFLDLILPSLAKRRTLIFQQASH